MKDEMLNQNAIMTGVSDVQNDDLRLIGDPDWTRCPFSKRSVPAGINFSMAVNAISAAVL
jgi:hypothetical protein